MADVVFVCFLTALNVEVDRRMIVSQLKSKLEPYLGTSADNFRVSDWPFNICNGVSNKYEVNSSRVFLYAVYLM